MTDLILSEKEYVLLKASSGARRKGCLVKIYISICYLFDYRWPKFPISSQQSTYRAMKYKLAMIGKNHHVHSKELETINLHFGWLRVSIVHRGRHSRKCETLLPLSHPTASHPHPPLFCPRPSIPNTHFVWFKEMPYIHQGYHDHLYYRFCQVFQLFFPRKQLHLLHSFACCPDLPMTSSGTRRTRKV